MVQPGENKGYVKTCPSGKKVLSALVAAFAIVAAERDGRDECRYYLCDRCGKYHLTSLKKYIPFDETEGAKKQ